ncbi:anaphase-promoting complex subunit, putative [Phytophthora infestans T30-4]|uniref:Anaphase-promoting complex subunit, putative n=1 Tax=Phytophthora infestans (strain T30-4) TaxID=403677 RepID=D0MYH8_PHYIT|nr:anaphase-promoting complex subunit, putative [Phytophthora infestans T30-4]EEY66226.1 anaphase-promoting complex subunit, putative [Phytophthora infestans T30-4]|eukprot:XP_002906825.1 anaphase-promoting complex subunit, putative [Phytophthora infestans T30-4]
MPPQCGGKVSIRVSCAGVRVNQRRALPTDGGRVFFSESQYSSSPFLVRVTFDSVSFIHRGTHVVERRFTFPDRILHAVLAEFSSQVLNTTIPQTSVSTQGRRARKAPLKPRLQPHLCVLVRSDCLNVYTAAGEVFEVALPFQANRLLPMEGRGLLLQRSPAIPIPSSSSKRPRDAAAVALARKNRRASTSNRGDGGRYKYSTGDKNAPARPRYFTLRHPLDEVKPVALSGEKFLSDSALEAVDVLEDRVSPILVAFHRWEQRFCVFRMNVVQKSMSSLMPEVKVVDGPTWTRYRTRSDLEKLRVGIEPDWTAAMLWKTPRVGPATSKPMFLSPIVSSTSRLTASPVTPTPLATITPSTSSGIISKLTFIASGADRLPLLCIMDKDAGTLLMKPISQQQSVTPVPDQGGNESDNVHIMYCRDAAPVRHVKSCEVGEKQHVDSPTDIVVLEKDGSLVLYRAQTLICRLALPDVEQNGLVANVQLNSVDKGDAYEIVYPDLCGSCSGKIWRCEHPLKIVSSPLLQQVFDVLDYVVPSTELDVFKAHVICRAQQKARDFARDDDLVDGGLEWQAFCESIAGMLPEQTDDKDEVLSSSSSFDLLCQSEYHDMYQYEHAMLFATMELPATNSPLHRTRAICRVYELISSSSKEVSSMQANAFKLIAYLTQDPLGSTLSLDDLPVGMSFPIIQAIRHVKHHPPPSITEDICAFVGREDLSIASAESLTDHFDYPKNQQQHDLASKGSDSNTQAEEEYRDDCDGLEDIISRSQPLFPADQRMKEVARLLRSSRPLCLKLEKTPDLSDLDYAQQQQARLLLLCKRSMALSVARGMVTLGSFDVSTAQSQIWRLQIPALPLQGRKPPANAIVELDLSGYAKELTYWPQFHNGCATGLQLPAHDLSGVINRHWIKYHRPSVNDTQRTSIGTRQAAATPSADTTGRNVEEAYAAHAGLLLGIGLRGHLKCLSMADVYNYLSLSNEFVTVAIMLGMASTAAHCRHKRKQQATPTKSDAGDDESHAPLGADQAEEMAPLEADQFFSDFSELSSSDQTPLLGTGLELALERSVSKMLCLHVPSLLPPPFGGFSVPASTQTAALLGLGILYQGTGYRLMTELLLTEIARSPSSAQFVGSNSNSGLSTASFDQLEGYALAAGMALGLVVLGRGQTTSGDPGLADLKLEEKLHKYIVGGAQQYRDANAAGSCLYRGRRWHSFGNVNGFNSAVNGSNTANGAPNNTGASPGAGRNTKPSSDRSGARSGGEHVNIGVTACASALALAFMYMQTDNKAVAAQLAVPDTLILLDYVRPDILLVRTLAKNLVMWNDISPTTEWIEQHEVPTQLLQVYESIQTRRGDGRGNLSGSPAHSDLHSICEAYANIITGACMSIGLRFAGTGNSTARSTLRKYVLHFRELRSKASSSSSMILRGSSSVVAAATERATVERCLAVCAQALALIDAGTGNVESLTLLRSITLRQRVDAAMTYGNHMALSMAIGLLFLGGGRATVSRSKEAIAALVISLYPMPPMNTADNKYHLQAFRHLYVLAIDTSRLLETVDVNTRRTCAVQVRVDLRPTGDGSDTQPLYHVLQSPCLLPDIATIERLVISDPGFYPIDILTSQSDGRMSLETGRMRTANSLRLELLRGKNVVFLKRRCRKDLGVFADFAEELEQQHGLRADDDSGDTRLRKLFRAFFTSRINGDDDDCDDVEDDEDVADWGSSWWAAQLSSRALEQVQDEEQLLMPTYLNALHALFRLQQVPQLASVMEVVDLKLLSEYCRLPVGSSLSGFGVWLSNQTEEALSALWHRTSLDISSLASARVQLLVESSPSIKPTKQGRAVLDALFVSVLVRYFGGPSASSVLVQRIADKDWRTKFQRVLAACSRAQHQSTSPARFKLSAFLDQDELTEAEKTFWLKLVSFFLFSN